MPLCSNSAATLLPHLQLALVVLLDSYYPRSHLRTLDLLYHRLLEEAEKSMRVITFGNNICTPVINALALI